MSTSASYAQGKTQGESLRFVPSKVHAADRVPSSSGQESSTSSKSDVHLNLLDEIPPVFPVNTSDTRQQYPVFDAGTCPPAPTAQAQLLHRYSSYDNYIRQHHASTDETSPSPDP